MASNIYHDWLWYPTKGAAIIRRFHRTKWGRYFLQRYGRPGGRPAAAASGATQDAAR
jgi:hypothetical protein